MSRHSPYVLLLAVGLVMSACADDGGKLPLGASCTEASECESGVCTEGRCARASSSDDDGICPGIRRCVDGCIASATGDVSPCSDACYRRADTELELMLADAISVCTFTDCVEPTASDSDEVRRALFACQRQSCLGTFGGCFSGGVYGAGDCAGIAGCLGACDPTDGRCARECFTSATQAAADAWFDWSLCERATCYSASGTPATDATCAADAQAAGGPCASVHARCFGPN